MTDITWNTKAYGREHDLNRLNRIRNNRTGKHIGPRTRLGADRSHTKITLQLRDRHLMMLRERLIKATAAGDLPEVGRIELCIRDYLREPKEVAV
jgi:hypothetical protein